MRKAVIRLALVVLSLVSVVFALASMRGEGLLYWYLFFSPLVLAAYFFGAWGASAVGVMVLGTVISLYRGWIEGRPRLPRLADQLASLGLDLPSQMQELGLGSLEGEYQRALAGAAVLIAGAIIIGWLQERHARLGEFMARIEVRDPLTGLPTRQQFIQRLRLWSEGAPGNTGEFALIVLDIDHFTELQQRYGNFSGDLVLERVGKTLKAFATRGYFVGRLGSDEFGVAVPSCTTWDLPPLIRGLRGRLAEYDWTAAAGTQSPERITASFGVAAAPWNGRTPSELLSAAWRGVEVQKAEGGDGVTYAPGQRLDDGPPTYHNGTRPGVHVGAPRRLSDLLGEG